MDSRLVSIVIISVGFVGFVNFVLTNPILDFSESSSEITQAFLDCKHSDYRTYIQCLKRHKRQPHDAEDFSCMHTCMQKCENESKNNCVVSCMHCLHTSSKRKHHVINITETEYETECISGNCTKDAKPTTVNVTNVIHVHIHYNNTIDTPTTPLPPFPPSPPTHPPPPTHPSPPYCPCYFILWTPCYCRPQYPICQYQHQWPCSTYGGYDHGYGLGYSQLGLGTIGIGPVLGTNINSGVCACSNGSTVCDECNPPAG